MNKQKSLLLVTLLMVAVSFGFTSKIYGESSTKLDISGLAYIHYAYDLSEDADFNGFELTRSYIDFKFKINRNITFRVTPDFKRLSGNNLEGFIKYAYVEFQNPLGLKNTKFRFGMQPTAWEGYMTKWWGYRWINRTPAGAHKLTTSSDLGISLLGNLANKAISYQISFRNGEGYMGEAERDSAKTFETTLQLTPLKGLPIHFFGHGRLKEFTSQIDSRDNLYAGAVYYKSKSFHFGAEYNYNQLEIINRSVLGLTGSLKLGNVTLLARYDFFDPNLDIEGDLQNLLIAGIGCRINKNIQTMVDVQWKTFETENLDDDIMIYLHWEIRY